MYMYSLKLILLIALHVHVPGIFRQLTLHRIILQSHNENIARYFNESEVMMYLLFT